MPTPRIIFAAAGALILAAPAFADDAPAQPGRDEPLLDLNGQPAPQPAAPDAPAPADAQPGPTAAPQAAAAARAGSSPLRFTFATDVTSAYFFRGIRQEDRGLIVQPAFTATYEAYSSGGVTVSLDAGTWNSFHDRATGAAHNTDIDDKWYECDLFAGVSVAFGHWVMRPFFTWYSSPSDAFEEVYEIAWTVSYNDEHALGALALRPTITIARELGPNGADGAGNGSGTYLELGVNPGLDLVKCECGRGWSLRLDFPQTLGLSLADYYENAAGTSDAFGYFDTGVELTAKAPTRGKAQWSFWAGAHALFLGDGARQFNRNQEDVQFIASGGVSVTF